MAKKDVFICDNCEVISQIVSEQSELPYANGWRQIEFFEFKASKEFKHGLMKKQFCTSNCMLHFMKRFIQSEEEALHKSTPILNPPKISKI
tara:strand:- start:496 stop:768 length:273 start_codon:yes stop_codon:yes gene_type:complete